MDTQCLDYCIRYPTNWHLQANAAKTFLNHLCMILNLIVLVMHEVS